MLKITNKCSFFAEILNENNKLVQFNVNVEEKPSQKQFVGKEVGYEFIIKDVKNTYKVVEIFPYEPGRISVVLDEQRKIEEENKRLQQIENENKLSRELISKFKRYGFKGFIHTTEFENFCSIMEREYLLPRNKLINEGVKFKDKARIEVIEKTTDFVMDCCRFYYKEGTPTNNAAGYEKPIVLIFDESLISDFADKRYFAPQNAVYRSMTNELSTAINYDWEGIFERGSYGRSKYNDKMSNHEITKIRNAEFLIQGEVPISYIDKIIVRENGCYEYIKNHFGKDWASKVIIKGGV